MRARPKERFSSEIRLTPETVSASARTLGDLNPLHHDAEFAVDTRFGGRIASGAHTSALLMSLTATHFSKTGAMLGLEFSFRFRRPVFADETVRLEWLVVRVRPSKKLGGEIVDLRGRLLSESGETAVGAKGSVLLVDEL